MYVVTTIDVGVLGLLRNVSKAEDKINKNILPGILCGCVMLSVRTPDAQENMGSKLKLFLRSHEGM